MKRADGPQRKGDRGNGPSRRAFLKAAGGAGAALALSPLARPARALEGAEGRGSPAPGGESRLLGTTGLRVSTIGFGAMLTRDADVIRRGIDLGIDYVDTADCYMGGENERIVGRALKGIRDKVVLASKVHVGPVDAMVRSVERSLSSLGTDVVDLMQLHGISSEAEVLDGNAREALSKLVGQGKVRFPGVTTHSGQEAVIRAVQKHGFYRTVLVAYNFRSPEGLSSAIREAGSQGIGIIGMKTQAGGYAVPGGPSPHQAALAWVLANPGVATTIPGITSFAQLEENLKARGMRLSWAGRKSLARYEAAIADRHCTMCGGCAGACPRGVDVPAALRCLTYLEGYRQEAFARSAYRETGTTAAACSGCGSCAVRCRAGLSAGSLARQAHARLA